MKRRAAYKGLQSVHNCLPLDCASTMGVLLIIGCILPATSLKAEAIQECKSVLACMEEHAGRPGMTVEMPDSSRVTLVGNSEGRFKWANVKALFEKLGLPVLKLLGRLFM